MNFTIGTGNYSHVFYEKYQPCCFLTKFNKLVTRKGLTDELPKFTSRPERWPLFMATYEQTSQFCRFSREKNDVYLNCGLNSVACNTVKSLLLNTSCIPQILSTLQMNFGHPELIINILRIQIKEMPPTKEYRLESIVVFPIEVQNLSATMKGAGLENFINNKLQQELVSKLSGLLKAFWEMHKISLTTCTLDLAQGANSVIITNGSCRTH